MRLLCVTSSWPRHTDDYGGHFVRGWARAMVGLGHEVDVVAPHGQGETGIEVHPFRDPAGLFDGDGAPEALAAHPLKAGASGALALGGMARMALRVARRRRPDVIVAHWLMPGGLAALPAARLTGTPLVVYAHGSDVALLKSVPGGRLLARLLDRMAHACVFVADHLRADFRVLLGGQQRARHEVLPMGIDPPQRWGRAEARRKLDLPAERPIVATVGRLVPIKGFDVLIEALAGWPVDEGRPLWVAAGDGPERERLSQQARATGVEVRWLGAVSPAQRDVLLSAADVFAWPSRPMGARREGSPMSVKEALAMGLPVVASALGDLNEWVTCMASSRLQCIPPDDSLSLRQTLSQMCRVSRESADVPSVSERLFWSALARQHGDLLV